MRYNNFFEIFQSVGVFTNTLKNRPLNKVFANSTCYSEKGTEDFTGTPCLEVADNLLQYGDYANLDKIKKCMIKKQLGGVAHVVSMEKSVCGSLPIVGAYLSGSPKCMFNSRVVTKNKNKVVNIYINASYDYSYSTSDIIDFGAKIVSLVMSLELSGLRVNVFVGYSSTSPNNQIITMFVKVKGADSAFNKAMISYPLINPSFCRRHGFWWTETLPTDLDPDFTDGYGSDTSNELARQQLKLNTNCDNRYYIDFADMNKYNSMSEILDAFFNKKFCLD